MMCITSLNYFGLIWDSFETDFRPISEVKSQMGRKWVGDGSEMTR